MVKAKNNLSVRRRRKKLTGVKARNGKMTTIPAKAVNRVSVKPVVAKTDVNKAKNTTVELIDSMNLDEMLDASKITEMSIRGEKIPAIKSPKVKKYVGTVLRLNKDASTKREAEMMQENLTVKIVEANRKTTNVTEGKRLYQTLMKED